MELAQLAVFVRPPREGLVKTRLESMFGAKHAAELYAAFVEDTLALCTRVRTVGRVDVALWAAGPDDEIVAGWGRVLKTTLQIQPSGDLGARLGAAFDEGLRRYERVVVIGSDAPTLPLQLIVDAFNALERAPMTLGPANDGGYYAVGARYDVRPRFDDVAWSTPSALRDTMRANAELDIALLSPWYDIDEPSDLELLRAHLSVSPASAPATARCLQRLAEAQR